VWAEIKVLPPDPNVKAPDGSRGFPESVLLRRIDSEGGPNVKPTATEDGSGMTLGGEGAYGQVILRGGRPFLKIVGAEGKGKVAEPWGKAGDLRLEVGGKTGGDALSRKRRRGGRGPRVDGEGGCGW
jgi:hypothetical protein